MNRNAIKTCIQNYGDITYFLGVLNKIRPLLKFIAANAGKNKLKETLNVDSQGSQ